MLAASSPEQPQEQDLSWPDTTGTLPGGPGNYFSQGTSLFGVVNVAVGAQTRGGYAMGVGASSSPANVCTLWCAIGLGALVRGVPLEKVRVCVGELSKPWYCLDCCSTHAVWKLPLRLDWYKAKAHAHTRR